MSGAESVKGSAAITTIYPVRDASGELVAEHVREDRPDGSKYCRWRRPSGDWSLNGTRLEELPLYGIERLADWPEDRPVVLVEGEKAADALNDTGHIFAVGTVTGASATPGEAALDALRGREVILWPDFDEPGQEHMKRTAEGLRGLASTLRLYTWHAAPEKGADAADHPAIVSGDEKALASLLDDLLNAPEFRPTEPAGHDPPTNGSGLKGRVYLGDRIKGGAEPPEQLVEGVLYEDKLHAIVSEPGEGKTLFALWAVLEVIRQGRPVLYFDGENGVNLIAERLEDMGASPEELDLYLHYYQSPEITLDEDSLADLRATVEEGEFALVIFDSLPDFLALAGLNENDAGDVTLWIHRVGQPLKDAGAAVLLLDHVTKSTEGRGRYARGSGAKLAKMDVSWTLTKKVPFDRERVGELELKLCKDREAYLPARQKFSVGGTQEGLMFRRSKGTVEDKDTDGLTDSARQALDVLEGHYRDGGATFSQWRTTTGLPKTTFRRARNTLLEGGFCEHRGEMYYPKPPVKGPQGSGPKSGATGRSGVSAHVGSIPDKTVGPQGPRPQNGPTGPDPERPQGPPPYKGGPNGPGPDPVSAFLADPPEWWKIQARVCLADGVSDRLLDPLANSTAIACLGSPHQWRDVLPAVSEAVKKVEPDGR